MHWSDAARRRFIRWSAHVTLSEPWLSPTNIFAAVGTPAESIFELSRFVLALTAIIFVFGLLVYAIAWFRVRSDDGAEPPQVYGSNQVELAWTVVPVLIVLALFLATSRVWKFE